MKKITVLLVALLIVMGTISVSAAPDAFSGVKGFVIDSVDFAGWTRGGDIVLINDSNGTCVGSMALPLDGIFSINYGTDGLSLGCTATGATDFQKITVIIDYSCGYSGGGNCIAPGPGKIIPSPNEIQFTNFGTGIKDLQTIQTNTGPLAVSLQNVTADSNTTTAVGIGFVVMMLAGVTFVMVRRREVA